MALSHLMTLTNLYLTNDLVISSLFYILINILFHIICFITNHALTTSIYQHQNCSLPEQQPWHDLLTIRYFLQSTEYDFISTFNNFKRVIGVRIDRRSGTHVGQTSYEFRRRAERGDLIIPTRSARSLVLICTQFHINLYFSDIDSYSTEICFRTGFRRSSLSQSPWSWLA